MTTYRKNAVAVGLLFILGTLAGVLSLAFEQPLVGDDNYLAQVAGHESQLATGALMELTMGVALVGVAVAIYPVLKRYSEVLALGYVAARTIEGMLYALNVVALLSLITVGNDLATADSEAVSGLHAQGDLILAARDWAGSGVLPATAFGLSVFVLNFVLYRGGFVPHWLSLWGLIAGVPYVAAGVLVIYGLEPLSTLNVVMDAPLALQEMVFAVWLLVKGFSPAAFRSDPREDRPVRML